MRVEYLEIVTRHVDEVCDMYEAALGVSFGAPVDVLGHARTAAHPDGGRIGVRAPMSPEEEPVIRPYWLVEDVRGAVEAAERRGAVVAHPPLELPGQGTFAILIHGETQHGLWQV